MLELLRQNFVKCASCLNWSGAVFSQCYFHRTSSSKYSDGRTFFSSFPQYSFIIIFQLLLRSDSLYWRKGFFKKD